MIYILVYFKILYYINFNIYEWDNKLFWINMKFCKWSLWKKLSIQRWVLKKYYSVENYRII